MPSDGFRADLQKASRIVWLVIAAVCGLAVLAPLFLSPEFLFQLFPVCAAKASGGRCFLCGMTTAFVRIAAGDWIGAQAANGGSLVLYFSMAMNFLAGLAYTMLRVIRHANT